MTIEESNRERAKESFDIFANRVQEHHDDPNCNRRLYQENIARYRQNLKDWVTRFTELLMMDDGHIYETIMVTHILIEEMMSDPRKFSAPSREPIAPSTAQSDRQ